MSIYDSFIDLVDQVGWSGDVVLMIFGFSWAVWWIINIAGWGLSTALFFKAISWFLDWLSKRRKKP